MVRRRQRKALFVRRRRAWIFWALSTVGAFVYGILDSSFFRVESVEIRVPSPRLAGEVRGYVRLPSQFNVFTGDLRLIRAQVERCPEVKSASVGRKLPRTLVVSVTPRRPAAVVRFPSGSWYVDEEGVLFRPVGQREVALPVIGGLAVKRRPVAGDLLRAKDFWAAWQCLQLGRRYRDLARLHLDVSDPNQFRAWTATGVKVLMGRPIELDRKIVVLASALQWLKSRNLRARYIDVSDPAHPTWKPA